MYTKALFTLNDYDCENDAAKNWVLLVSMQLFASSDMKHQRKISRSLSQSLSVNGPQDLCFTSAIWIHTSGVIQKPYLEANINDARQEAQLCSNTVFTKTKVL